MLLVSQLLPSTLIGSNNVQVARLVLDATSASVHFPIQLEPSSGVGKPSFILPFETFKAPPFNLPWKLSNPLRPSPFETFEAPPLHPCRPSKPLKPSSSPFEASKPSFLPSRCFTSAESKTPAPATVAPKSQKMQTKAQQKRQRQTL